MEDLEIVITWPNKLGLPIDGADRKSYYLETPAKLTFFNCTRVGGGAFGQVYKCNVRGEARSGTVYSSVVAVKKIPKSTQEKYACGEIEALEECNGCPYIVQFSTAFSDQNYYYLVMRYYALGSLDAFIRRHGRLNSVAKLRHDLVEGLEFIHSRGILHRDLKPQNILVRSVNNGIPSVCITDFGLAKYAPDNEIYQSCVGTPHYMAPEVIAQRRYDQAVDYYSLGGVLYFSKCGQHPPYPMPYKRNGVPDIYSEDINEDINLALMHRGKIWRKSMFNKLLFGRSEHWWEVIEEMNEQ